MSNGMPNGAALPATNNGPILDAKEVSVTIGRIFAAQILDVLLCGVCIGAFAGYLRSSLRLSHTRAMVLLLWSLVFVRVIGTALGLPVLWHMASTTDRTFKGLARVKSAVKCIDTAWLVHGGILSTVVQLFWASCPPRQISINWLRGSWLRWLAFAGIFTAAWLCFATLLLTFTDAVPMHYLMLTFDGYLAFAATVDIIFVITWSFLRDVAAGIKLLLRFMLVPLTICAVTAAVWNFAYFASPSTMKHRKGIDLAHDWDYGVLFIAVLPSFYFLGFLYSLYLADCARFGDDGPCSGPQADAERLRARREAINGTTTNADDPAPDYIGLVTRGGGTLSTVATETTAAPSYEAAPSGRTVNGKPVKTEV